MTALDSVLACPRCDTALARDAGELTCKACQITWPEHDGVPWLFPEPTAAATDWHNRWQLAVLQAQQAAQQHAAAAHAATRKPTRERLVHLQVAYERYAKQLQQLLAPLQLSTQGNLESFLALRTRLPPQQALLSYAANVFRDWCWGDDENTASCAAVCAGLRGRKPQRVLVLGAGAGRLAFDVHQELAPELTVALDNNPLLGHLLAQLASGSTVTLTEFPLAPATTQDTAIERILQAPNQARAGLYPLLGDALRAPFQAHTFDVVITPWLLDVIDEPAQDMLPRINRLLAEQGIWINHGSMNFSGADPTDRVTLAELLEIAADCGFAEIGYDEVEVPYLACPVSRHSRRERVVTMQATKTSDTSQPQRHQALPEWIVTGRTPVPLQPEFKSQALSTRIHAYVMSLIDGKRSLKDMAAAMEHQQLMTKAEAEQAIRGFLTKMFDSARQGRGF